MTRRIDFVPLHDLVAADRNPKRHDIESLGRSVERFGFVEPIVEDGRTGKLVSGHGRAEMLLKAHANGQDAPEGVQVAENGTWLVPVVRGWSSVDDAEAEAFLVTANRLVERGGWDSRELADVLASLAPIDGGLDGVGYSDEDVAAMLARLAPPDAPESFPELDPTSMQLTHECPRCGYQWTGSG